MKGTLMFSTFMLMLALTARAGDPVAQMTFQVIDDFGSVVTGAPVIASTFLRWVPGGELGHDEYDQAKGVTDTNGLVVLKLPSKTGNVRYSVSGVFDRMNKMEFGDTVYYVDRGGSLRFTNQVAGKWQPWNSTVEIQIKKVLNPIPMYARFFEYGRLVIPAHNTPLGFDLMKSDWLPPYGNGKTSDFIFRLDCQLGEQTTDRIQYFDAALSLSFPNDGDGIQEVVLPLLAGSVLHLPRYAPATGYASNLVQRAFEHKDASRYERDEKQNFIYRVRTKKDEKGQIIGALYGKISGPVSFGVYGSGAKLKFRYYLNPTPNDRNLEFDPTKNLFRNLSPSEEVREP